MHELAICQALIEEVRKVADSRAANFVSRVTVVVGPLAGIEPALLARAFYVARAGGPAETAELVLEASEIRVRCQSCGRESTALPARLVCGRCGDFHIELLSGDELLLKSVELVCNPPAPVGAGEPEERHYV